jgi:PAS domain S-box-containing protein
VERDRNPLSKPSFRFPHRARSVHARHVCVLLAFLFVSFLIEGYRANAQTPKTISVREATDYQGNQPIPGRLGQRVTVEGVLIDGPVPVGTDSSLADLQDSTGGIALYSPNRMLLAGRMQRGDEMRVSGTIEQFEGQTEILVQQIARRGAGTLPPPRDVLAANLLGIRYLGQLVRLVGDIHPTKTSDGRHEIILSDRSGHIPIYLGSQFLQDAQFVRRLLEGGRATVVGIAAYSQPGNGQAAQFGYRLIPRDPADFAFRPAPAYRLIIGGLAFLFLVLVGIYLALRKRGAERRANEMAVLLENLNQSEKALRQSEQRYRLLYERNLAGFYRSTLDGRILECNTSFVRIFGYASREEIVNLPVRAQDLHSSPSEREDFVSELLEKKVLSNLEMRLHRKDGSPIWVLENASLLEGEGDSATLIEGTLVDITERKSLEEQLRQSQKMEAIGQLAGGVGHDFNNLLMVITGNSELLLTRIDPSQPLHKHAGQIKRAADQAAVLIRQLLAFSRMQVLQPRVLDLNRVVAEIGKMLPRLLRADIEVVVLPAPSLGQVKADQNQIEQIILNLATNARDAMPRGGKLTIETRNVDFDENYGRLHPGIKPGQYVMLAVSDTGTGMDAETRTHIFEPFFTTKEPGKGTGLGLSMVYGIVKQSGGWIWVYSEVERGTAFKIYLPKVSDVVLPDRSSEPPSAPPSGTETILLVEDQDAIRELARPFLEKMGYTVLEASNGEEALQIAQQRKGKIDLLLTDLVMPKMDGHELAQRLAILRPEVRVLYMSGYAEYATDSSGTPDHDGFRVQKPFSMDTLARRVREALDAKQCAGVPGA